MLKEARVARVVPPQVVLAVDPDGACSQRHGVKRRCSTGRLAVSVRSGTRQRPHPEALLGGVLREELGVEGGDRAHVERREPSSPRGGDLFTPPAVKRRCAHLAELAPKTRPRGRRSRALASSAPWRARRLQSPPALTASASARFPFPWRARRLQWPPARSARRAAVRARRTPCAASRPARASQGGRDEPRFLEIGRDEALHTCT